MLSAFFNFYFSLLAAAIAIAYLAFKRGNKKSLIIVLVLTATLLAEVFSQVVYQYKIKRCNFSTHVFNLIEYPLFCLYYLKACNNDKFKFLVRLSIPLFLLFSILFSIFLYRFETLPVVNIDVEGFLLFIIYTHLLFNIDVDVSKYVYANADFWIATGLLVFFGGVFTFLGLYPILFHIDPTSALEEYGFIIRPLDIIFYSCIIIGQICLIRTKRYSIQ
jgi:hypothetical protein